MSEQLCKVTVTRGRTVIHQDVIPGRDVAMAEKAWTRPLGLNKSRSRFKSEPLTGAELGDLLAASITEEMSR